MTILTRPKPVIDTDPVEAFVQQHQTAVWRYLRLLGCEAHLADDLTQDSFLIALRKDVMREEPDAAIAWLRRVARHLWIDRQRSLRRRREVAWADQVDLIWSDSESERETRLEALRICLDGLDGRSARVVHLRYSEKRSRAEIASELGLRENGLKTMIQRLRSGLRDCVEGRMSK